MASFQKTMMILAALGIYLAAPSVFAEIPRNPIHYKYPGKVKLRLDGETFGECLALTAQDLNVDISLDRHQMIRPFHSGQFFAYLHACWSPILKVRCYEPSRKVAGESVKASDIYKTGQEETLKAWILSQPDNSIDPLALFSQSLVIFNGNLWNALLSIHDLLRNNGRFYDSERYSYPSSVENAEALFNKLIDIRGDLRERGGKYGGDHTGSWYRIWGVMLSIAADELPFSGQRCRKCERRTGFMRIAADYQRISDYVVTQKYKVGSYVLESRKIGRGDETDRWGKIILEQESAKAALRLFQILSPVRPMSEAPRHTLDDCKKKVYLTRL